MLDFTIPSVIKLSPLLTITNANSEKRQVMFIVLFLFYFHYLLLYTGKFKVAAYIFRYSSRKVEGEDNIIRATADGSDLRVSVNDTFRHIEVADISGQVLKGNLLTKSIH